MGVEVVAEALVSITLAFEGLVAVGVVPSSLLLLLIGLHGYLLGGRLSARSPRLCWPISLVCFLGRVHDFF